MFSMWIKSRDRFLGPLTMQNHSRRKDLARTLQPALLAVFLVLLCTSHAVGQLPGRVRVEFVNGADTTQGLAGFSFFPAINNRGEVAFTASDGAAQNVYKLERRGLRSIAAAGDRFGFFTDDVVINAGGTVGFRATLNSGGRAMGIFTSDGTTTKTIIDSTIEGLPGPGIGIPSINASGTVAFEAFRAGFKSMVIFTGDGGALSIALDTLSSDFQSFGAVAINAGGEIVFHGTRKDRSDGIFVIAPPVDGEPQTVRDVVDSHGDFFDFGDPVISNSGIVADFALTGQGLEIFSARSGNAVPRTDPRSGLFLEFEHPSLNNRGAVAFSALEANGAQAIFIELTGKSAPITLLQTGDALFGARVTGLSVGRFALNDHLSLAFEYELDDGRSGIAIANVQPGGAQVEVESESQE